VSKTIDHRLPPQKSPHNELLAQVAYYASTCFSPRAKSYLISRGITPASIDTWQLGYFPRDMSRLFAQVNPRQLRDVGLVYSAQYSSLQRRITFPICDQYGKVVAIAGRPPISEEQRHQIGFEPKYWHNAFSKGKILYGLHLALPYIRETQTAIITEGQFDVITGHQFGIKNVICPCGTALTEHHILLLARYATTLHIVFDSDQAGRKVADKIRKQRHSGININIVRLPQDCDFDSFVQDSGPESFLELIETKDFVDSITEGLKAK